MISHMGCPRPSAISLVLCQSLCNAQLPSSLGVQPKDVDLYLMFEPLDTEELISFQNGWSNVRGMTAEIFSKWVRQWTKKYEIFVQMLTLREVQHFDTCAKQCYSLLLWGHACGSCFFQSLPILSSFVVSCTGFCGCRLT